jgi:hypothetical protein
LRPQNYLRDGHAVPPDDPGSLFVAGFGCKFQANNAGIV